MRLIKLGGSILHLNSRELAESLSKLGDTRATVVIGYGKRLRELIDRDPVDRRALITPSGVESWFTDEYAVGASYHAAALELRALSDGLKGCQQRHLTVLGCRGLLTGERKQRVRYMDGNTMCIHKDDLSGSNIEVNAATLTRLMREHGLVVIAPLLANRDGGAPLVCDADEAAVAIARQIQFESVTFVTETKGLICNDQVVQSAGQQELLGLRRHASGGMRKKLIHVENLLASGVDRVLVGNLSALSGIGSMFYANQDSTDQQST